MRVAISYRDGTYCMYDPTTYKFADGVDPETWMAENTIEIPDSMWRRYQEFMEHDVWWQRQLCGYDNMIHDRKEKNK